MLSVSPWAISLGKCIVGKKKLKLAICPGLTDLDLCSTNYDADHTVTLFLKVQ